MRKSSKIILIILMAFFLRAGWFVYENWNTIDAFIYSLSTTSDDSIREIEKTKQELQTFLENEENIEVRDLTAEETQALVSGSMTEEEIIDIITGQVSEPKPSQKPQTNNSGKPPQKPAATPKPVPESEKRVSELIAKLYVQKGIYLNKIDNIEAQVRAEYMSNPNNWKTPQTIQDVKQVFLKKYLPTVAAWEKECDTVVYGILDEIRTELKKAGKDESIVNTMRKSYIEEKKLKKSYFINRYMD